MDIFELYKDTRHPTETFREFADRTPVEWWQQQLARTAATASVS